MPSGNNGNTVQPVFINGSQLQYQTDVQSNQLHLLGTTGGGCNVYPVNYFATDNLVPINRSNKREREGENISNIQRQQKLQMSLNYNHNNISVRDEVPKENLVSTGLRLSYDDDERNSSVTSASGSIIAASNGEKDELDQFIKIQAAQMAKGVRDIKQRHTMSFLTTLEKGVSKKLQEKDHKIHEMNKKNMELVERMKQVTIEAQNWQYRAKYNESVVNVLKANLQQAMSQSHNNNNVITALDQGKEGFGDTEIDDAASSYIDSNKGIERTRCKMCNAKEVCVLVGPCRHLSLCKECDVFSKFCPVCKSFKRSSVEVLFS